MARPLPLVQVDPAGSFSLGEEALGVLRSVKGPIGVVAVCGRARQGKSYILNQIVGASTGSKAFEVASSQRPCTK
eukprot:7077715-Pyramimonas_sp.AAC.3